MDDMLLMRLNLLLEAGEIDEGIIQIIVEFIKVIEKELSIPITEDNGSMFVTHMAMALSRIKKGEEILPMDDSLLAEIESSTIYDKVPFFINKIEENHNIHIPESEYGYIALHLCNLVNITS